MRKLQQYEVANEQFISKYKSMPGDSPYLTPAGNNNKLIDGNGACSGKYLNYEAYNMWLHLNQSGTLKGNYLGYEHSSCGGTTVLTALSPLMSEYGGQKFYMNYSKGTGVTAYYDGIQAANTRIYSFNLTTIDYIALDEKMDGQTSSKIMANSENSSWANNPPASAANEVISVVYSPDRQLTQPEMDALQCTYVDCGS